MRTGWMLLLIACMPAAAMSTPPAEPERAFDSSSPLFALEYHLWNECTENREYQECLGIDGNRCKATMTKIIKSCEHHVTEYISWSVMSKCLDRNLRKSTELTEADIKACNRHVKPLTRSIKNEAHINEMPPESRERLPIYPNYKTVYHASPPKNLKIDDQPLGDRAVDSLRLILHDPVSKVVEFYKNRLKGFNTTGNPDKDYKFVAGEAPNPDDPNASKKLLLHEHVHIHKGRRLGNGQRSTLIDIGYRP